MRIKFVVEMAELRKKVNFVRNGLGAGKTDLAVLLMRFEVTGAKVIIFAANKEMFCRTEMKVVRSTTEEAENGSFAVLGFKVERLIAQVEAEQATFIADGESLEVQAGFLTVNFETYDGAVLKTVENGVRDHLTAEGLVVDRGAFEEALSCAKSCTTLNSIRPDVTHVELRNGRMLSSDGRKIMVYTHDGFPPAVSFKCPATMLAAVVTAVKNVEAQNVQVIQAGSYYYIKGNKNEYSLGVRKVEREFPAVEAQITKAAAPTDEVAIDKHVLESMLNGVSLGLPSDEVKVQLEAGGVGAEAYLEVSAVNQLGKKSHERASCGRKTKELVTWPLSFKHLLDTLAVFKGDSVVDMMVMAKMNLLMVRDTTEAREVLTVIPFRTDKQIEIDKQEAEAQADERKKKAATATPKVQTDGDVGELVASAGASEDLDLEG